MLAWQERLAELAGMRERLDGALRRVVEQAGHVVSWHDTGGPIPKVAIDQLREALADVDAAIAEGKKAMVRP